MWPAELLSPAELATLTGYVQPSAQKRWLAQAGIRYIDMPGRPAIVRRDELRASEPVTAINVDAFRPRKRKAAA
jgi:hypothetical protein